MMISQGKLKVMCVLVGRRQLVQAVPTGSSCDSVSMCQPLVGSSWTACPSISTDALLSCNGSTRMGGLLGSTLLRSNEQLFPPEMTCESCCVSACWLVTSGVYGLVGPAVGA